MNGELVDWADAKIHVASHGLHYGTGVFEGIRCYSTERGPAVFRLRDHLKRLETSAQLLFMQLPYSVDELRTACHETVAANGLEESFLRPIARQQGRFNNWLAVKITNIVGTMWCAYAFACLALVSLPEAIHGGTATLISWIAQTFLQLVLLSIIMVGQNVASEKSDRQLQQTYRDAEALLKISDEIKDLVKQNNALTEEIREVVRTGSTGDKPR